MTAKIGTTNKGAVEQCSNLLKHEKSKDLPFHNFNHTQEVINKVFLSPMLWEYREKRQVLLLLGLFL